MPLHARSGKKAVGPVWVPIIGEAAGTQTAPLRRVFRAVSPRTRAHLECGHREETP
ncbi:hypothetical protein GCM10022275_02150 [Tessaracoccus defluvii]